VRRRRRTWSLDPNEVGNSEGCVEWIFVHENAAKKIVGSPRASKRAKSEDCYLSKRQQRSPFHTGSTWILCGGCPNLSTIAETETGRDPAQNLNSFMQHNIISYKSGICDVNSDVVDHEPLLYRYDCAYDRQSAHNSQEREGQQVEVNDSKYKLQQVQVRSPISNQCYEPKTRPAASMVTIPYPSVQAICPHTFMMQKRY
jgi:hypothetical protein